MRKVEVGDKVKFTGKFLKNTGQMVGGEGQSRWIVQKCCCSLCSTGRFVAVDQVCEGDDALRHIATGNLYRIGTLVSDNAL